MLNYQSIYELEMAVLLKQNGYKFEQQYRFCERKWKFDFVLKPIKRKIAIEINGGIWIKGKHTYGQSYIKDLEKLNQAQLLGWKVLQYTPENLTDVLKDLK